MAIFNVLPPIGLGAAILAKKIASRILEKRDEIDSTARNGAKAVVDTHVDAFDKAISLGKYLIDNGVLLAKSAKRHRLLTFDKDIPCL